MSQPLLKALPRIIAIIISLAVSLGGILLLGWDWRQIIVLYWLTNVTVGVTALIDISRSDTSTSKYNMFGNISPALLRTLFCVFFTAHYGMFTLVHGVFVFLIVSGNFFTPAEHAPIEYGPIFVSWLLMLLAMVIARWSTPQTRLPIDTAMMGPYRRILALQLSIIFGVWVIVIFHLPSGAAILLALLNTFFELRYTRPSPQ